jgi:hypothetical protein
MLDNKTSTISVFIQPPLSRYCSFFFSTWRDCLTVVLINGPNLFFLEGCSRFLSCRYVKIHKSSTGWDISRHLKRCDEEQDKEMGWMTSGGIRLGGFCFCEKQEMWPPVPGTCGHPAVVLFLAMDRKKLPSNALPVTDKTRLRESLTIFRDDE